MAASTGRFVWHELLTTDPEAARAFYGAVVGWTAQAAPPPNADYTMLLNAGHPSAGMMALPKRAREAGARPGWLGYIGVEGVDAAVEQATGLGATVHLPPHDIPGVGRIAVIADPQQAAVAFFQAATAMPEPLMAAEVPGQVGWNELLTTDWEAAFGFYAAMFGWRKDDAVDMGPMGTYQLFGLGGPSIGGMFNKPPAVPEPFWQYYFTVADIDAGLGRITAAGGQVLNGPMEVPGGMWIVQALDPQGAIFALVGKRVQKVAPAQK